MMAQLPYGANIEISSTSSSISSKFALGRADYITSTQDITSITYKYEEKNGSLIGIDTNLKLSWDKTKKTFTLSNSDIFGTDTKPYINLQCNNVKIPISFYEEGTNTNNIDSLLLEAYDNSDYVIVCDSYILNWNKESTLDVFIEKDTGHGGVYREYYGCKVSYSYLNNNNKIVNGSKVLLQSSNLSAPFSITIPKLNGTTSSLKINNTVSETRKFINYFALSILVHMNDGHSTYKVYTLNYIEGTNKIYTNADFPNTIKGKYYLDNNTGIPKLYNNLQPKWNSNFFYRTQDGNYYISPSTSEIKYELSFNCTDVCVCDGDCDCDGYCYEEECPCYIECDCYGECGADCPCLHYDDCDEEGCSSDGGGCPSDGGGSSEPWEDEKQYVGRAGGTDAYIIIYNNPGNNRYRIASYVPGDTFTVLYEWNGWFQTYDGWISGDDDWWIN